MTRKSTKLELTDGFSLEEVIETPLVPTAEIEVPTLPLVVEQEPTKPVEPGKPPVLAPKPERVKPVVRAQQRNVPRFSQIRK